MSSMFETSTHLLWCHEKQLVISDVACRGAQDLTIPVGIVQELDQRRFVVFFVGMMHVAMHALVTEQ